MNERWSIQLFGGLRLRHVTRFRTQKTGALLAFLAFHPRHAHAREVLIERFWPDTAPESGRHNLSHALSSLRGLLEPPGVPAGSVVVADRFTVGLNPDAFTTDVAAFDAALQAAARASDDAARRTHLTAALHAVTGRLLPGYYEDWIAPAQEEIDRRLRQAALQLAALSERSDDPADALAAIRDALSAIEDDVEDDALRSAIQRLEARSPRTPTPAAPRPAPPGVVPTGTVTVLATDVPASEAEGARLRAEFLRAGGHPIAGDDAALVAVFNGVADAWRGAIAGVRSDGNRARLALHTGDFGSGDGEDVPQHAIRLLSAAHPGQILCSEATSGLLHRERDPRCRLRDLGVWRLGDEPTPERLFQVDTLETAAQTFPPPRATPVPRARLPLQFTRFFGREAEIDRIGQILASPQTRLLTLTGPGGTGKTRLGIEGAARFAESFDGDVWFVPLADIAEPSLIVPSVLQAMGVPVATNRDPLVQLTEALGRRPALLLLDNVEQVVEGGSERVQNLLSRVESLKCLATSRQTLGIPGEIEFPVSPLPTPNGSDTPERLGMFESVRLFVDRAQAARPDFRITAQNAPAVAELCDRLEGLPLAIELAAARAQVLSPAQMLAQLGNRFEFLVSRRRGVAERQRTLHAAVDWSYRLLPPEVQRFFRQLCVFRGGWTLEAAEAVCEEPLALDLLAQLRDSSMVTTGESVDQIRFRMLETLREYAASLLPESEAEALRARHTAFFVAMGEEAQAQLRGPDQVAWLDRLEADHDNVRAVLARSQEPGGDPSAGLRLAGALDRFWSLRGHFAESRERLSRAIDLGREGDRGAMARALRAAGNREDLLGGLGARESHYRESLRIYRELGDRSGIAEVLVLLGALSQSRGDLASASAAYAESLATARAVGDSFVVSLALYKSGQIAALEGDVPTARERYTQSLDLRRALGDRRGIYLSLHNLGFLALDEGDGVGARTCFEEALATAEALGDRYGAAAMRDGLAAVASDAGDFGAAAELVAQSLSVYRELRYQPGIAGALRELGGIALKRGDRETARVYLTESLEMLSALGLRLAMVRCLKSLAVLAPPEIAARLWGAAQRAGEAMGYAASSRERRVDDERIAAARAALGDDPAFEAAWEEGRDLSLEQAVAMARAATDF